MNRVIIYLFALSDHLLSFIIVIIETLRGKIRKGNRKERERERDREWKAKWKTQDMTDILSICTDMAIYTVWCVRKVGCFVRRSIQMIPVHFCVCFITKRKKKNREKENVGKKRDTLWFYDIHCLNFKNFEITILFWPCLLSYIRCDALFSSCAHMIYPNKNVFPFS